ncbi:MAG: hypothetical protein ABIJ96_15620 [Elusimicrobiota bacterium]
MIRDLLIAIGGIAVLSIFWVVVEHLRCSVIGRPASSCAGCPDTDCGKQPIP